MMARLMLIALIHTMIKRGHFSNQLAPRVIRLEDIPTVKLPHSKNRFVKVDASFSVYIKMKNFLVKMMLV